MEDRELEELRTIANTQDEQDQMPLGHRMRFEDRLAKELPIKKSNYRFKIAAAIVILIGFSIWFWNPISNTSQTTTIAQKQEVKETITLGDLSPDLKKVEYILVAGINKGFADLEVNDENQELANEFLQRIEELKQEYDQLNEEMNVYGPSDQLVDALINNLKLRLQLLSQLKEQLKKFNQKNSLPTL